MPLRGIAETKTKHMTNENTEYTASSIKVLDKLSIDDATNDWVLIPHLADKYGKDEGCVRRAVKACREAGVSVSYYVDRYCKRLGIPIHDGVNAASMIIQREYCRP